ncbi:MAG: DUF362 domain-containing protein [Chloroflexi bacterium]|nr:DUF362 domain-containing protein [Chloroflexota bacterium]
MKRREFLQWGVIGGAAALLCSFFIEPTARLWDKAYDYYSRQPYLKFPPPASEVPGQSTVFHMTGVPTPTWDTPYHAGLDALLELMAQHHLPLYQMKETSSLGGPDGLIASTDVVLLKVNSQWGQRGMTSTDVVRGLIQRLVDHPARFQGEIVVVENGQTQDYLDSPDENNDESPDHRQSLQHIVNSFNSDRVSLFNWRLIGQTAVNEFEEGDDRDGYVLAGKYPINYPKFTTAHGTSVSLKRGIWDGVGYDASRLKLINLPVLKSHVFMGATGAVKNYAGVMSRFVGEYEPGDDWDYHANFYRSWKGNPAGLLGTLMAMRFPSVTLMDAIYVNPHTNWAASFDQTPRVGALLASTDPVALDYYASQSILIPLKEAEQAERVAWSDPDAASVLRSYLLASQARLLEAGYTVRFGYEAIQSVIVNMG